MPESPEKTDSVIALYTELHAQVRANQSLEQNISFAVGGLFVVFSAYVLRRQLGTMPLFEVISLSIFMVAITSVATVFLRDNIKEMRWQCQRIVGCEEAMGFYNQGEYLGDKTLLPIEAKDWGKKDSLHSFNSLPFITGVWLAMIAAIIALSVAYAMDTTPKDEAKPSIPDQPPHSAISSNIQIPTKIEIELHGNDHLEQQSLTALSSTIQQLSKTVDLLIPAVNSLVDHESHPEQQSLTALSSTIQQLSKTVDLLIPAVNSLVDHESHPKPPSNGGVRHNSPTPQQGRGK